jgi:serine phosphatase RsbU (regulator of sigma subunit)
MEIWGGNRAVKEAIGTPGLDIWVSSEPFHAEARGGDVHYVSLCGGGIITRLIIADVSGHGEGVAGFSQALRNLMRRNINRKSQAGLVKALNRQFTELAQLRRFATAVVATYLATTHRLTVCNAAHPRPLWFQASSNAWSILSHETVDSVSSAMNLPLGVEEESTYDQFSLRLDPGDLVVFYTDALTEAMSPAGQLLGEPGLLAIVGGLDLRRPDEIGPALLEAVRVYREGVEADDDVTLLVIRNNGGPPRKPSIVEKIDIYAKVFGLKTV